MIEECRATHPWYSHITCNLKKGHRGQHNGDFVNSEEGGEE